MKDIVEGVQRFSGKRVQNSVVEQIGGAPAPQEPIVEGVQVIPQERENRTQEQLVDVPVPRITEAAVEVVRDIPLERVLNRTPEQIVDVPLPPIMEAPVDVVRATPQDRVQNRTPEPIVEVPVPRIMEAAVEVVRDIPLERVLNRTPEPIVECVCLRSWRPPLVLCVVHHRSACRTVLRSRSWMCLCLRSWRLPLQLCVSTTACTGSFLGSGRGCASAPHQGRWFASCSSGARSQSSSIHKGKCSL